MVTNRGTTSQIFSTFPASDICSVHHLASTIFQSLYACIHTVQAIGNAEPQIELGGPQLFYLDTLDYIILLPS